MSLRVKAADDHPVAALATVWIVLGLGLTAADYFCSSSLILGAAGGTKRTALYSQIATMAIAVMAAVLTVLSILVALPDRPRVVQLRRIDGWRLLQGMLLATGGVCLATVVAAELGLAFDTETTPHQRWIEQWCFASVVSAAVGTLTSGLAFALVLRASARDDGSGTTPGRGNDSGVGSS